MSDRYQEMVEDLEEREGLLSDFQRDFISRVSEQMGGGETLSDWTIKRLTSIYEELTGENLPA